MVEYEEKAKYWLERTRQEAKAISGAKLIDHQIRWIKEYVSKAGIGLKDIGTSEEELEELEKEAHKNEAIYWLKIVRKDAEEKGGGRQDRVRVYPKTL